MPTKYVRPYSKGQRNDFRDAEAVAEAVQRPTKRFVPTTTADQLDLQASITCASDECRSAPASSTRSAPSCSSAASQSTRACAFLRAELPTILGTRSNVLSPHILHVIEDLTQDWRRLDERIDRLSTDIEMLAHGDLAPNG